MLHGFVFRLQTQNINCHIYTLDGRFENALSRKFFGMCFIFIIYFFSPKTRVKSAIFIYFSLSLYQSTHDVGIFMYSIYYISIIFPLAFGAICELLQFAVVNELKCFSSPDWNLNRLCTPSSVSLSAQTGYQSCVLSSELTTLWEDSGSLGMEWETPTKYAEPLLHFPQKWASKSFR